MTDEDLPARLFEADRPRLRAVARRMRSHAVRKEDPLDAARPRAGAAVGAEHAAELADSVGVALLVVLGTLTPVERLAFVLHDLFAVPFEEIAPIVGRSPAAARQLAGRARRRVRSDPTDDAGPPT